jgi:endonuclease YncB( thermonuclease family)
VTIPDRHFVAIVKDNLYRVIDGDTVKFPTLDHGGCPTQATLDVSARVWGIDTPENKRTKDGGELERNTGQAVAEVVREWLGRRKYTTQLYHVCMSKPKFAGRTIAKVIAGFPRFDGTDDCLSAFLLDKGLCKPYMGKKKEPWTEEELKAILEKAKEILG